MQEWTATAQRLAACLQAEQNTFIQQTTIQESSMNVSFFFMVETAGILCPESKKSFFKKSAYLAMLC